MGGKIRVQVPHECLFRGQVLHSALQNGGLVFLLKVSLYRAKQEVGLVSVCVKLGSTRSSVKALLRPKDKDQ